MAGTGSPSKSVAPSTTGAGAAEPGLEFAVLFRRVRAEVLALTEDKQRPFEYGSLISEDLYFRPLSR